MNTKKDQLVSFSPGAPMILDYEGHRVRFVGTPEIPEWVAQDACAILGIENVSQALADFDDDEKGICTVYRVTGNQRLLTVYESGLYKLIFKSRKPAAKKFQKWVSKEVLPSIRKYGVYPPPENSTYEITLKPYTSRLVWIPHVRRKLPKGYWCVFIEGAEILLSVEHVLGPAELEMREYDLLDGSIGRRWSDFRQDKPWMGARVNYEYTFPKDDPRGTVRPWAYPMQELGHFKTWLHDEYWRLHFPAYLKSKYGAIAFKNAIPLFAAIGVPLAITKK